MSLNHEHGTCIKKNIELLDNVKTVRQLVILLGTYWDYFNYTLLESIVVKYGSERLQLLMKNYVSDLKIFWHETTVAEYIASENYLPPVIRDREKFVEIKSHIAKPMNEISLYEVEQYRLELVQETKLQKFALILGKLEKGSLKITWLLDKRLVPQVKSAPWNGKLAIGLAIVLEELHVREILVDRECIYLQSKSPNGK